MCDNKEETKSIHPTSSLHIMQARLQDDHGFAYAAEHLPSIEAAFTMALQAVLAEQPRDPVAWVAGFLGEYSAEQAAQKELSSSPAKDDAVHAEEEAALPMTPRSQARDQAASQALAALGGAPTFEACHNNPPPASAPMPAPVPAPVPVPAPAPVPVRQAKHSESPSATTATFAVAGPGTATSASAEAHEVNSPVRRQLETEQILNEVRALLAGPMRSAGTAPLQTLNATFEAFDRHKRDAIRLSDFTQAFVQARLGIEPAKLAKLHAHFDRSGRGEIQISEFVRTLQSSRVLRRRTSAVLSRR